MLYWYFPIYKLDDTLTRNTRYSLKASYKVEYQHHFKICLWLGKMGNPKVFLGINFGVFTTTSLKIIHILK